MLYWRDFEIFVLNQIDFILNNLHYLLMSKHNRDIIVNIKNLNKIYRLYNKPHYRFLDLFGLLYGENKYREHAALNNINLNIHKGEKVGIIGRNGAGKSTLLKLISGVIEPTSGMLNVYGDARALLQIGSGFHPEFTGRENVIAYLAQLSIESEEIEQLLHEVIEFTELEEYIDQPIKTYSTGMSARLMFATSTIIAPHLLILDEILSVGDAYFTHKSMDRIRELCDKDHSTLLLVSHDIYSTAKICERMIWIDEGEIMLDAPPQETLRAYEDSIRMQDEKRLRKKTLIQLEHNSLDKGKYQILLFEICGKDNLLLEHPFYLARVTLKEDDQTVASLPLIAEQNNNDITSGIIYEYSNWGEVTDWLGKRCRPMQNFGSPHHKITGYFIIPRKDETLSERNLFIECEYGAPKECSLMLHTYIDDKPLYSQTLSIHPSNQWLSTLFHLDKQKSDNHSTLKKSGQYGTGEIQIVNITLFDENNQSSHILEHGKNATIIIDYKINDKDFKDTVEITLNMLKDGISSAVRYLNRSFTFDASQSTGGRIIFTFEKVRLGIGSYSMSLRFSRSGYNNKKDHKFVSINPDVYLLLRDILEFKVLGGGLIAEETSFVADGDWRLETVKKEKKG